MPNRPDQEGVLIRKIYTVGGGTPDREITELEERRDTDITTLQKGGEKPKKDNEGIVVRSMGDVKKEEEKNEDNNELGKLFESCVDNIITREKFLREKYKLLEQEAKRAKIAIAKMEDDVKVTGEFDYYGKLKNKYQKLVLEVDDLNEKINDYIEKSRKNLEFIISEYSEKYSKLTNDEEKQALVEEIKKGRTKFNNQIFEYSEEKNNLISRLGDELDSITGVVQEINDWVIETRSQNEAESKRLERKENFKKYSIPDVDKKVNEMIDFGINFEKRLSRLEKLFDLIQSRLEKIDPSDFLKLAWGKASRKYQIEKEVSRAEKEKIIEEFRQGEIDTVKKNKEVLIEHGNHFLEFLKSSLLNMQRSPIDYFYEILEQAQAQVIVDGVGDNNENTIKENFQIKIDEVYDQFMKNKKGIEEFEKFSKKLLRVDYFKLES